MRDCCVEEQVLSINFGSAPRIADAIAQEPGQESMLSFSLYWICFFFLFSPFLNRHLSLWLIFSHGWELAWNHAFWGGFVEFTSRDRWMCEKAITMAVALKIEYGRIRGTLGSFTYPAFGFLDFVSAFWAHWTALADFSKKEGAQMYKLFRT